jgi:DNA polymerase-3 subunit beta
LLIETGPKQLRAVATDGHRLALCQAATDDGKQAEKQVIVPRKGVLELQRLLSGEGSVRLELGENHIRIQLQGIRFTSKLIDGRFPEYERVIPQQTDNQVLADRVALRSALQRTAILSNEKYRGIRLIIRQGGVVLQAHNPEQEESGGVRPKRWTPSPRRPSSTPATMLPHWSEPPIWRRHRCRRESSRKSKDCSTR